MSTSSKELLPAEIVLSILDQLASEGCPDYGLDIYGALSCRPRDEKAWSALLSAALVCKDWRSYLLPRLFSRITTFQIETLPRLMGLYAILEANSKLAASITSLDLDMSYYGYPYNVVEEDARTWEYTVRARQETIMSILHKLSGHLLDLRLAGFCLFPPELRVPNPPPNAWIFEKTLRDIISKGRLRSFDPPGILPNTVPLSILSILPSTLCYVALPYAVFNLATTTPDLSTVVPDAPREGSLQNVTTVLVKGLNEGVVGRQQHQTKVLHNLVPRLYRLVFAAVTGPIQPEKYSPVCYSDRITHLDIIIPAQGDNRLQENPVNFPRFPVNLESTLALADGLTSLQQLSLVIPKSCSETTDRALRLFVQDLPPRPSYGTDELKRMLQECVDWEKLDRILPPERFPKLAKVVVDVKSFGLDRTIATGYEEWITKRMTGLRSRSVRISVDY
ncbi:hypothetical protein CC2G_011401 [Coprinopsis cinerea AmutBmut pab1-1]|nr:hypothetical protein CC2G_011401 [Coprinopsis cinerea AmutBmut pab1-1]